MNKTEKKIFILLEGKIKKLAKIQSLLDSKFYKENKRGKGHRNVWEVQQYKMLALFL